MARIALLSVSNKEGIVPFAQSLTNQHGFQVVSSGGTAKLLQSAGIQVTKVADYTGAPEILEGRVKTLHPKIHGGILADPKNTFHIQDLKKQNINNIELVVVNLYPFEETIADENVTWEDAIEKIDIGGPTMLRAAAKNHSAVSILTRPDQYNDFLNVLNNGDVSLELRRKLALLAFEHTTNYDMAISRWISQKIHSNTSPWLESKPIKQILRYGENPHQKANWYGSKTEGWGAAIQLQGKELSANNLLDLESALSTVREFGYESSHKTSSFSKAAVVIKHTNPCGVALGDSASIAFKRALDADRVSAFGGIVALNCCLDKLAAKELKDLFLECIVAPEFSNDAKEILSKKKNLRLLELNPSSVNKMNEKSVRSILGGFLIQDNDNQEVNSNEWEIVTKLKPNIDEEKDLSFAWKLVKHVRSNAIVVASNQQSLGIGAGQMNRIGSAKIALEASSGKARNAILASDGFFPFDDTIRMAAKYGIKSIIQPGGSIRDNESIRACNELGISMVMTKRRHFLH